MTASKNLTTLDFQSIKQNLKDFLSDPTKLEKGMEIYQDEQDAMNAPIREQIEIINGLIIENREQLDRLLDLYLSGSFDREVLLDRKNRLEDTITSLEKRRTILRGKLTEAVTAEQIATVSAFAKEINEGLREADEDFVTRRRILEYLGTEVTFAVENGDKVLYLECNFGMKALLIMSNRSIFADPAVKDPQEFFGLRLIASRLPG